jgi:post-segregation antitoxin (ccd killing protein)
VTVDNHGGFMSKRDKVAPKLDSEAIAAAETQARAWLEKNRSAIDAYNRMIEQDGFVFSDGARTF